MSSKWKLEIYDEAKATGSEPLSSFEYDNFPSLRLKMVENGGRIFRVRTPDHANQVELAGLLDLRGQGFNVERISCHAQN